MGLDVQEIGKQACRKCSTCSIFSTAVPSAFQKLHATFVSRVNRINGAFCKDETIRFNAEYSHFMKLPENPIRMV